MAKNQNKQQSPVSMEDFEKMMAEIEQLKAKNAKLKDQLGRRPEGALWLPGGTIYFPKGSRRDLIGKTVKCAIPTEAIGKLYLLGEIKESSNGNAYCKLQGWIDVRKLNLPAEGVSNDSAAEKATLKDLV